MSQKIDPKEVLIYLNELGYTNINAQQLKEFITDLKKLIKYEYKHRHDKENTENVSQLPTSSNYDSNNYAGYEHHGLTNQIQDTKNKQKPSSSIYDSNNYAGSAYYGPNNQIPLTENKQKSSSSIYGSNNNAGYEYYGPNDQIHLSEHKQNENVFDPRYKKPTASSKAKEIPKRERQISVHITKARSKNIIHDHCVHVENQSNNDRNYQGIKVQLCENLGENVGGTNYQGRKVQLGENLSENVGGTNCRSQLLAGSESTIRTIRPESTQSLIDKARDPFGECLCKTSGVKIADSRSIFMKSCCSKPINKCDPVALYHHYQAQWKKQKFPGQERHSDLRWAVREKLLKGPRIVCSRTTCAIQNKPFKF